MLELFLWGFITNLPCHAVTLKSNVGISKAVLQYLKTDVDIKEVIILDIFLELTLLLSIALGGTSVFP